MKIGMIGLGDIAQKAYLPILTQLPDIEPVLCTRQTSVLAQLQQRYRIQSACTDYKKLLSFGVEAVMIHAATPSHEAIAGFFLKQGLPVFVDKPLADSYAACERLYELAAAYKVPLYVGFNRRHLPLIDQAIPGLQQGRFQGLTSLRWEKHRHNEPGDIRRFIFDDFIHPLDSANLFAAPKLDDIQVLSRFQHEQLAAVELSWQQHGVTLQAVMDRQHGQTRERIAVHAVNQSWAFDGFVQGQTWSERSEQCCKLPDWTPMLASKGFDAMINDWLDVVRSNHMADGVIDRNLSTHRVADELAQELEGRRSQP